MEKSTGFEKESARFLRTASLERLFASYYRSSTLLQKMKLSGALSEMIDFSQGVVQRRRDAIIQVLSNLKVNQEKRLNKYAELFSKSCSSVAGSREV